MKQFVNKYLFLTMVLIPFLGSCKKETKERDTPTSTRKGMYVLVEGMFNTNNSALTYYDYETKELVTDQFNKVNGRGIGDTGNDFAIYGSKMYIVVNGSSTVEILNARTAVSIKKVELKDGARGRQPRSIVFNRNKAFISNYDGTVAVLDTASMNIEKFITVGANPEKMAISNNKLYVANSGGLNYPDVDKTVSVIDLNTLTEIKKITVIDNPHTIVADEFGDVYVLSYGIGAVPAGMTIISSSTDVIKAQAPFNWDTITISGDLAYITTTGGIVKVFNVKNDPMAAGVFTLEKDNFITDGTKITTGYGLSYDAQTEELFVADAKNFITNGEVFCFDKDGKKKYSIPTGINPHGVVFINK